jgi:hypothetical protein
MGPVLINLILPAPKDFSTTEYMAIETCQRRTENMQNKDRDACGF